MYSQNEEEKYIVDYFGDRKGTLLSIGENDGRTLSNSLRLIELGWKAVLVEPSSTAMGKLLQEHVGRTERVQCIQVAVADKCGAFSFFESGTHLNQGDTSLLSTLDPEEMKRWERSGEKFEENTVECVDYKKLCEEIKHGSDGFDFISIDAEGVDMMILKQIDLSTTQLLCIEWNGDAAKREEILEYTSQYGLNDIIYTSLENLIIAR